MICLNRFQTSNQQLDIKRNHSDFFTRNNAQQMTHGTIIRKNSEYIPAFRPYVIYQNISFSFVILFFTTSDFFSVLFSLFRQPVSAKRKEYFESSSVTELC